jgi:MFS family permease
MWWLSLVMLINRAGTMVIPFLTVYLTEKGFTIAQAGFAMGAFGAGSIVGGFGGGWLTDKVGHLKVQVGSLLLNGLLFYLLGQMETYPSILVTIFFLSSIGEAFRPANSAAIAAFSTEQTRTRGYSLNRPGCWRAAGQQGLLPSFLCRWFHMYPGSPGSLPAF